MEPRVQLVVEHFDHQTRYYPANEGWRIDAASRCIVIGKGIPRTHVPLDNVAAFHIERVRPSATAVRGCCITAAETLGERHDADCPRRGERLAGGDPA